MKFGVARLAVTLSLAAGVLTMGALAATPKPMPVENSPNSLVDDAAAQKLWDENTPPNVIKLYPTKKYRFTSEVGGGFNASKMCVVNARAMLLPVVRLPIQGVTVIYAPIKSATAFDAVPHLSQEQCQELARAKLKEAIQSVVSVLVAS